MADRGLNGNSSLAYLGVRPTTPPQLVIIPDRLLHTIISHFVLVMSG